MFATSIHIRTGTGSIGLLSYYIKPAEYDEALQQLESALTTLRLRTQKLLAVGDSNGHSPLWSPVEETNPIGERLEDMILKLDLVVLNEPDAPPTFHDARGRGHWIDLGMATRPLANAILQWTVEPGHHAVTDHELIVTQIQLACARSTPARFGTGCPPIEARCVTISKPISTVTASSGTTHSQSARSTDRRGHPPAHGTLQRLIQQHTPTKSTCNRSRAWYDEETKRKHQQMKNAERAWKRSPTEARAETKDRLTLEYRTLAQKKKQTAFHTFCATLGTDTMWSGIQRLMGSKCAVAIDMLKTPTGLCTESQDIAKELAARYFRTAWDTSPHSYRQQCTDGHRQWTSTLPFLETEHEEFTAAEVELELESGRPQAAPGHDHIPNLVYKKLSTVLGPPVATIFNACLELGYFPATFRIPQVVNVSKAGKDPTSAAGYHPIALLSTLGKKLESLLCRRFAEHMEARKIWSPHQYGFRRRKSTTQALIRLLDRAALALNHRNQMVAVSFDLQAAFDSTHPDILWRKLQEAELPQYLLRLLDGFVRNREACLLLGQE